VPAPGLIATETLRERSGDKSPSFQPYDAVRARDGWVVVGAVGAVFDRACQVVGLVTRGTWRAVP
jgi:crotonobetainyl-CoA:carnitine CoA-transferase CaiB-like acyl-CoA transferase